MTDPFARRKQFTAKGDTRSAVQELIDRSLDQRERQGAYLGPGGAVLAGGAPPGGGGTDTGALEEDGASSRTAKLTVADNASATLDLGAAASYRMFTIDPYHIQRNTATPVLACGRFNVLHNGTSAWVVGNLQWRPPSGADTGVTFSAAITGGIVQLIATASNLTPDASATITVLITSMEAL